MIKNIFYTIVITIITVLSVSFFLPRAVHVERTLSIDRPASTVFALVNGYATIRTWSPWASRDPSAVYTISGPATGVGARMEWEGDPRLSGKGWQEITHSVPYTRVQAELHFDQQGMATTYFDIHEQDGGSAVTWGFDTHLTEGQSFAGGVVAQYFGLLFDRWIGSDYETGLNNLKTLAESLPNVDFSGLEVEVLDVAPLDILYIQSDSSQDPANLAGTLAAAYQEITAFMTGNQIEMSAQPMTITRAWSESGYAFDAAIPVVMKDVVLTGNVQAGKSPSGRAVRVIHRGPYDRMMPTYEKLSAYMTANGLREGPVSWEHYISDPGKTPGNELITHIYFQIDPDASGLPSGVRDKE
jgi:effector-binding domain-containing protein